MRIEAGAAPRPQPSPRVLAVASLTVALTVALLVPPIAQWPEYHNFADRRAWLGVPRFADVVSNLPFTLVGAMGLVWLARHGRHALLDPRELAPWRAFFGGLVVLGPASACYHLDPNNFGLMLDRLAMSVVFMGWLAVQLGERLGPRTGRLALPWLLACGVAAVLHWYHSESIGQGDLRAWGYVQFWPVVLVLWLIWRAPARYSRGADIPRVYACYAVALLVEWLDHEIYSATAGLVSGHSLKHLVAALGAYLAYRMVRLRQPVR